MIQFGINVRHFRENAGLSHDGLSKITGLSVAYLRKIEAGTVDNVGSDIQFALADYFGVCPRHLAKRDLRTRSDIDRAIYRMEELLNPTEQQSVVDFLDAIVNRQSKEGRFDRSVSRFV